MAWTAPMTAVAGAVFTAAQFNANVRDNFLQTAPALATAAGQLFVSTAANAIAARTLTQAYIATQEDCTTIGYANIATFGPSFTINTGTQAIAGLSAQMFNSGSYWTLCGLGISGATSIADSDDRACGGAVGTLGASAAITIFQTGLTPGANEFTMHYRVTGGTGTLQYRRLWVLPL